MAAPQRQELPPSSGWEAKRFSQPVKEDVDDRCRIERQDLAKEADHPPSLCLADAGSSEPIPEPKASGRPAKSAARVVIMIGTKTQEAKLRKIASVAVRAASPFSLQCEIDDHDAVFLDDTDQQNNADDGYDPEILPEEHKCQQRADSGRRKR